MHRKVLIFLCAIFATVLGVAVGGLVICRQSAESEANLKVTTPVEANQSTDTASSSTNKKSVSEVTGDSQTSPLTNEEAAATPAAQHQAGIRVYLDPETGKIVPPPAQARKPIQDEKTRRMINTSARGLREERSPVAGGGVLVNLQGRFQSTVSVETDDEGNVSLKCSTTESSEAGSEDAHGTGEVQQRKSSE